MKKPTFIFIRLFVLSVLCAASAFANTTTLDASFNGTGYRIQSIGTSSATGEALVIQPDGKIIISGSTRIGSEFDKNALIRLNPDGTPDTGFGSGGTAYTPLNAQGWGTKLLLLPDGKILLGATAYLTQQQAFAFTVTRFTSAGVLDTTFNNTGYATANVPTSFWDICNAMTVQPDGKIVFAGVALTTPGQDVDWDMSVVRLNADGSLDTTFDGDGTRKIGTTAADEEAHSVFVQADGKILVGGFETTGSQRSVLMRLNADGSTDTSFGNGGSVVYQLGSSGNLVNSIARQSDGKILAAGGGKVARFSADGVRDMSFGVGGAAIGGSSESKNIQVLGNDKFLLANRDGVRRFMANGAIDTHFGGNFFLPGSNCYMNSLALQSDGKPVLGGYCYNSSELIFRFAVVRFQENRTKRFLDFNGDERTDISIYRPSNGQWWYLESQFLFNQVVAGQFGTSTDRPMPDDYSGDGKADPAVFRASTGEWYVLRSDNATVYAFQFGTSGDIPLTGDFDGDQLADAGVFRPSTGEWFILRSTGGVIITTFGLSGDLPVPSDFDGDFKTDIAIYRPSVGEWWVWKSSDASVYAFQFGTANDKPVVGDYTGDNQTDPAFWRPSTGEWFILRSEDSSYYSVPFGLSGDLPTPGNYSGDSRFDLAVFRPSDNEWHIQPTGGSYIRKVFGTTGDRPLPNLLVP